jgi:hypothetical protein
MDMSRILPDFLIFHSPAETIVPTFLSISENSQRNIVETLGNIPIFVLLISFFRGEI